MTQTLLVTGVSGKLGRRTVEFLIERGGGPGKDYRDHPQP